MLNNVENPREPDLKPLAADFQVAHWARSRSNSRHQLQRRQGNSETVVRRGGSTTIA